MFLIHFVNCSQWNIIAGHIISQAVLLGVFSIWVVFSIGTVFSIWAVLSIGAVLYIGAVFSIWTVFSIVKTAKTFMSVVFHEHCLDCCVQSIAHLPCKALVMCTLC